MRHDQTKGSNFRYLNIETQSRRVHVAYQIVEAPTFVFAAEKFPTTL